MRVQLRRLTGLLVLAVLFGCAGERQHDPVFVVLDVMLPKIDGWEVCRRLRKRSDVPILMLTA